MRTSILSILSVIFALFLTGCRQEQAGLTPVTGRVTFKGTPLTTGVVVFVPDSSKGENGPSAFGVIHEDGTFTLATGDAPGAQAGWYKVTVSAQGPPTQHPGQSFHASESIIPERYMHPDQSELTCKVVVNQPNSFEFNLSDRK